MRIGIDGRLWNETGVGRYIRNLVRYLAEIDEDNDYVLFVLDPQNFQFPISNPQLKRWKIVTANVRWHTIDEQLQLPAILEKEKLDLVHFPYFSVPYLYSRPFVVTIHDLIPFHFDTGLATTLPLPLYRLKRIGYKLILRRTVRKAAKIIAVSTATKEEIVKHLKIDPEKIVVTYEDVEDALKSKVRSQKAKLQLKTQNFFLYVGNAYPHKNLERLLDALNILIRQLADSNISLLLVGKEDYFYKRLKGRVKEMGLTDHVIFYGEANDLDLAELYGNAKALIIPSLMEGFGLPAAEAMANGCLVLASDIPALRETCGEAAIYFNPYDVDDLKRKMEEVCSNDLKHCNAKFEEGLRRVKLFSWAKMAQETLKIYKEVV